MLNRYGRIYFTNIDCMPHNPGHERLRASSGSCSAGDTGNRSGGISCQRSRDSLGIGVEGSHPLRG